MAHNGPPAMGRKLGRTPNAEWTDVPNLPYQGPSPNLPKLRGRQKWHELVEQWWENLRHMPHCITWTETDWQFALETALMKQQFWLDYQAGEMKTTAATEIRRREDQIGTTSEARRKLRIRYVDVAPDEVDLPEDDRPPVVQHIERAGGARPVTSLAERRQRARQAETA